MYSNPPAFGGRIVDAILNSAELKKEWYECIKIMSSRILKMRKALYDELVRLGTPGTWNHIIDQIGMFSYTGLNGEFIIMDTFTEEMAFLLKFIVFFPSLFLSLFLSLSVFLSFDSDPIAEKQVQLLINEFHIYLLKTGRISMCGLNENNVAHVAKAIHTAVTTIPN